MHTVEKKIKVFYFISHQGGKLISTQPNSYTSCPQFSEIEEILGDSKLTLRFEFHAFSYHLNKPEANEH